MPKPERCVRCDRPALPVLWNNWDRPVRKGAKGRGQEVIVPTHAALAHRQAALWPATDHELDALTAGGFTGAREACARLLQPADKQR